MSYMMGMYRLQWDFYTRVRVRLSSRPQVMLSSSHVKTSLLLTMFRQANRHRFQLRFAAYSLGANST
ncbi:hypothetical protein SUGI_0190690 [Cryptomeria japonica]|nr:hypothetical protein SUGI_0190690 [Cryptomeria japonica]